MDIENFILVANLGKIPLEFLGCQCIATRPRPSSLILITSCYGQRAVTGGKGTNSLPVKAAFCSRWCQPKVFDKKKAADRREGSLRHKREM